MIINGQTYRIEKMEPRVQFHVMRRLTPLIGPIGPAALDLLDADMPKAQVMANIVHAIGPLSEAIAGMSDEHLDYVLDRCLIHVRREAVDGTWHPIYIAGRGAPMRMFQDIDAGAELKLVTEVVKANLSAFFGQLSDEAASSLNVTKAESFPTS